MRLRYARAPFPTGTRYSCPQYPMIPERLLELVRAQSPITVTHEVSIPGPELRALIARGGPLMPMLVHPDRRYELKNRTSAHLVGPGLSAETIAEWQSRHPSTPLPADLVALLRQIDGIHLWADLDTGRGWSGIRPLAEWKVAEANAKFGIPPNTLVLSYHDNGADDVHLDATNGIYTWYDHLSFSDSERIGSTVSALLDYVWKLGAQNDPRALIDFPRERSDALAAQFSLQDALSLGVLSLPVAATFYDAALGALGFARAWTSENAIGYGTSASERRLAIKQRPRSRPAQPDYPLAFIAPSRAAVETFYTAALRHGGVDAGEPGIRPTTGHYGASVRDPEGHLVEAVFHDR